jgi:two-component system, OmpR family, alkaline phosphatase synthesis response regulator PhoP
MTAIMATILVIEDEQFVRESLIDLLNAEGYRTIAAENGDMGLQLAKQVKPDLILSDITMAGTTGYEVLKALKNQPETATIPFIVLTARSNQNDFRYCMQLGADDYLQKPCNPDELISAIVARLAKKSAIRAAVTTETYLSSSSRDGLLNYFYQELRNPLSNLNTVIYQLRHHSPVKSQVKGIQQDYLRELSVLQEVAKFQSFLAPECHELLQSCGLDRFML